MWIWRRNLSCFWWKYSFHLLLKLYYGLCGLSLSTRRGEVISQCSPPCPQCPSTLPTSSLLYYNWGHYTTSYYAILLLLLFYCYRGHYTTTLFYYYYSSTITGSTTLLHSSTTTGDTILLHSATSVEVAIAAVRPQNDYSCHSLMVTITISTPVSFHWVERYWKSYF